MRYGSVCSGAEAATVAWHPLGWTPAFFSEIERFPRELLSYHYPDVPLHGDFTTIGADEYGAIDLLVGGTPCQSFSVGGLRGGLSDDRGNLALEFLRLADRKRPNWILWENVPGVLSINSGKDFGAFLGGLAELGYGFAYRLLNSEYFGVPQRRRRVFVLGYHGDWRPPAAALFEQESLRGDTQASQESEHTVTIPDAEEHLRRNGIHGDMTFMPRVMGCLTAAGPCTYGAPEVNGYQYINAGQGFRRISPLECERLNGFPDNYTNIPGAGSTARYKIMGNTMAVPVMRWIGERISLVEEDISG